jgi:alpha-tubulin suppressor-like RCC1 family protein
MLPTVRQTRTLREAQPRASLGVMKDDRSATRGDRLYRLVAVLTMAVTGWACGSDDGPAGPPPPASALRYAALGSGYYHTCALTRLGRAYCWGGNGFGTLGDGTREIRTRPTAVAGNRVFTLLDAGAGHNCALTSGGVVWCWGQNDEGQLGDGSFIPRDTPVRVTGALSFVSVSAGHAHSCGLAMDGTAWCWGDDSAGQLGNGPGATGKSATPVAVATAERYSVIVAGFYQTCALAVSGEAWCWGLNDSGQNGDGTTTARHAPARVVGGRTFETIAPGDRFVCGASQGVTLCWGANRSGELGETGPSPLSAEPVELPGLPTPVSMTASSGASTIFGAEAFACGVADGGRATCWGGAIRNLRPAGAGVALLDDRIRYSALSAGAQHICGLSRDGHAYCGGANYSGQLGDDTRTDRAEMIAIPGPAGG